MRLSDTFTHARVAELKRVLAVRAIIARLAWRRIVILIALHTRTFRVLWPAKLSSLVVCFMLFAFHTRYARVGMTHAPKTIIGREAIRVCFAFEIRRGNVT